MNSNKNGRLNMRRITRTFHLAPSTRAIRAALAVSFTMLALAGSGAAMAGTCVNDATANTETCNGDFANFPGGSFVPVVDMTLILGDSAPTSVTPAAGTIGVDATWGGNVGVISHADITTDGADGIHQYGSTSATLNNSGSIATNVTAAGANAVDIGSYGNVSIVNSGDISASSTGAYDVTAVSAYSSHGNVSIDNQASGTITASATNGNAIAVAVTADSIGFIYNEGAITANSDNGIAIGVLAYTGYLAIARNHGSIDATSDNGQAIGEAVVGGRLSYAFNYGTITATSGHDQATGVASYGTTIGFVSNSGSIAAIASDGAATGVLAQSSGIGKALVINSGSIQATSSYRATGILASSGNGYAIVHNYAGTITATGTGTSSAIGIAAYSAYGSYVVSSGTVTATADGGPTNGIVATTDFSGSGGGFGDAIVTNSGSIAATSFGYDGSATGVMVQTIKGGARVFNSGSIAATAQYRNDAVGVTVGSSFAGNAYVDNSGSITASTGTGRATGIEATSHYGNTTIVNSGDISSTSASAVVTNPFDTSQRDYATGIDATSSGAAGFVAGITNVTNSGSITATSNWMAQGIEASAGYGVVTVTNTATGNITVTGDQFAIGIGTGHNGYDLRYGDFEDNITQDAVINNAGNITVVSTGNLPACTTYCNYTYAGAIGIGVFLNFGNDVTITNSGNISVSSLGGPSYLRSANGIQAITYHGDVTVNNSGNIAITATGGQFNWGMNASTVGGAIAIDNSGSITMSTIPGYTTNEMFGISASTGNRNGGTSGTGGGISVVNSGDINISGGIVYGIDARSHVINGDTVAITNSGNITAYGTRETFGILAVNYDASTTAMIINNSGSLTATSAGSVAGIDAAMAGNGATTITNSGDISTAGGYDVTGVTAEFRNYGLIVGSATINNSGSISTSVDKKIALPSNYGTKVQAESVYGRTTYGDVTVVNTGSITSNAKWDYSGAAGVSGVAKSIGIATVNQTYSGRQKGTIGDTTITNGATGSISATAEFALGTGAANASGIYANQHATSLTYNGNGGRGYVSAASGITITNSGAVSATGLIDATASGSATAVGILAVNKLAGYATVTNYGSVLATATNSGAIVATDPTSGTATATGISVFAPTATVALDAGGYVGAIATGASGTATGLSVTGSDLTATGLVVSDTVTAGNAGTIKATFNGAGGVAYGANITSAGDLSFTNSGAIVATSGGNAVGITLNSPTSSTLVNSGVIDASSIATSTTATATAIPLVNASADGSVNLTNSGSVLATASTSGAATATGILESAANVALALDAGSYVGATATGTSGTATALSLVTPSTAALAISNPGVIKATFNGAGGLAYGANITSAGDLNFTNAGQVFAANAGDAVGVQLNSATSNTLVNSGLISAVSSAGNSIAVRTNDATATLQNTGIINGAIVTGAGNDTFTNSPVAVWNPIGTATDFGAGDDTVSNAGTINLHNSAIALGAGSNAFSSSGLVTSIGGNTINVGAGNAFTNTGLIEMRTGATGDALTLTGNWAGNGQLGLDVNPLQGSADMLHVIGNVAAGSATKIDVNLLNLPTTATSSVPVVDVTGDSVAGSFVLGDVHFNTAKSFLVVQAVDLTSVIDTTNAKPDVFSVGVAVTGVTDSGALAASIVPGVESLMNSEVGTWRQRVGVMTPVAKGSVGLWVRGFDDSGTVNPGHLAGNFGQGGNFSFDQTNSGEEIGADFAITNGFSAGLMLGKAQANQHPDGTGVGRNKLSGNTRGAYATWMAANGFYVDGSYRTMSFDARLDSQAGESRTTGNADAFNLEVGQSWSFGDGFKLTPQVQYTRTTVNKADTLTGALAGFTPQGGTSSRGRAGVTLSDDIGSGRTVWTPYASLSAVHEFDGQNDFIINNTFSGTTDTKGTSALVEGGLSVKTGKLDVFAGLNYQSGGALKSFAGGQVGLRYSW